MNRAELADLIERQAVYAGYTEQAFSADDWRTIIAALRETEGLVLVPLEPTNEMVEKGRAALAQQSPQTVSHARVLWLWKDMLDARPNAKEGNDAKR